MTQPNRGMMMATHTVCNATNRMTDVEIESLFVFKEELKKNIDPVMVATELYEQGFLPTDVYDVIMETFSNGSDRTEINEFLISNLPANISIEHLVKILDKCGYRSLASSLFLTFLKLNTSSGLAHVRKSTSGQRSNVHTFFRRLKRMVHDAQFKNPRLTLQNMAARFMEKMNNTEDSRQRQIIADRCVAVIGAEIDAIAITFDDHLFENEVFSQMKSLIKESSNTLITDVVYYGRLANANSIAGKFNDSEDQLVAARSRAYNIGPCLELVNMLYIEVYTRLWQYEKFPTKNLRESLIMWGRIGLESLEEEDVDTNTMWRRMFILRMVFCLLGLGNRANVIKGSIIDDAAIKEATHLLADIDRNWYGIETRREMFYSVARARLMELNDDLSGCARYLTRAECLANEGHFEEKKFILQYQDDVHRKTTIRDWMNNQRHASVTSRESRNFVVLGLESGNTIQHLYEVVRFENKTVSDIQISGNDIHVPILGSTNELLPISSRNFVVLGETSEDFSNFNLEMGQPNFRSDVFTEYEDSNINRYMFFEEPVEIKIQREALNEPCEVNRINPRFESNLYDITGKSIHSIRKKSVESGMESLQKHANDVQSLSQAENHLCVIDTTEYGVTEPFSGQWRTQEGCATQETELKGYITEPCPQMQLLKCEEMLTNNDSIEPYTNSMFENETSGLEFNHDVHLQRHNTKDSNDAQHNAGQRNEVRENQSTVRRQSDYTCTLSNELNPVHPSGASSERLVDSFYRNRREPSGCSRETEHLVQQVTKQSTDQDK